MAETRRSIERAAWELFAAKGYRQTTVRDIAAAARVGDRTFFRYFKSKSDVVFARTDRSYQRVLEEMATQPAAQDNTKALLGAIEAVTTWLESQMEDLRSYRGLVTAEPGLQQARALRMEGWGDDLAKVLAQRADREEPTLNDCAVAHTIIGVLSMSISEWMRQERDEDRPTLRNLFLQTICNVITELGAALQRSLSIDPDTIRKQAPGTP